MLREQKCNFMFLQNSTLLKACDVSVTVLGIFVDGIKSIGWNKIGSGKASEAKMHVQNYLCDLLLVIWK